MSEKPEYVDVTKQPKDGYIDVTQQASPEHSHGDSMKSHSRPEETSRDYIDSVKAEFRDSNKLINHINEPSKLRTPREIMAARQQADIDLRLMAEEVASDIRSLDIGDPNELISVPMILSTESRSLKNLIRGRREVSQTVIVRKMPRGHYRKYYAKDAEGNYVGTERAAPDAGLVFVPSKSTSEDILRQVRAVAFSKEHHIDDFGGKLGYGGAGGGI
ncbi:hypothetical protein K432DRAFT_428731 [Lepidopterella palustris CBS 459.81]|uniref:Uncharacterized protein n=1 Tax=Lepidopterella palustris CBS 459.81 TaxID=1314670 RepID=A0A8E2E2Z3_9PEZI|nr:hypothetical protein K432DRAFT_428731 [Lepidopterella palustris CBS 459.81]